MSTQLIVGRPMTEGELSEVFGVSRGRLRSMLAASGIRPSFRVGRGRIACYGPEQVEALHRLTAHPGR